MPELPEVETMRIQLEKFLVGHTIQNIEIRNPKYEIRSEKVIGGKVIGVRRFAKVTSIDLSSGYSILTHVKLTGQFIYRGPNLKSNNLSRKVIGGLGGPHTHVIFNLDKNGKLYFNDVRRFGWIRIVKSNEIEKEKFISKLGPEPHVAKGFAGQALTFDYFQKLLSKSKRNIKVLLMDQTKIGGIGNIYANDALWLARINPRTPVKQLDSETARQLYEAILTVLKAGLKYGGASELAFVTPDGAEGEYQNHTLVYGREGKLCLRCGVKPHSAKASRGTVEKYFLGGRGTYICPICQK